MLKGRRVTWLAIVITFLILLLYVVIIKSAYGDKQNLFLMLIVSIPLLIIAIYNAWRSDHLRLKHLADSLRLTPESHFESLARSIYPTIIAPTDLRVRIGNDQCSQPYSACVINVGSMGDTDLESTFSPSIQNRRLEYSDYSFGEGLKTYHLTAGGLAWQIGSGYPGCRTENGDFNSKAFTKTAHRPEVKIIELKLKSVRKPIYSGDSFLSFATPIQRKTDNNFFSDSAYNTFRNAEGMIHFLNNLRDLSGGKPIGIRLCINEKKEFYQICHAARKIQLFPDFIVVEGPGRTIIHSEQVVQSLIPLYDALLFVSQTLQRYGLQNKIKVIADGNITSCFDILKVLALGANAVCIEMPPNTNLKYSEGARKAPFQCKSLNMYDYHDNLIKETVQLMRVCGFKSVSDITLSKFFAGLDALHSKTFEKRNNSVLLPGSVQKINNPKIKSHRAQNEANYLVR